MTWADWIRILPNIAGALSSIAVGVFVWLYWRQTAARQIQLDTQRAQQLANTNWREAAEAAEFQLRLARVRVEELEVALLASRTAVARLEETVTELQRRSELVG